MSIQHGNLGEFHPENDRITSYLERASLYLTANDIPGEKQAAVLLSSIGPPTYALLSDLFASEKPSSKSCKQISAALVNHYEPQRVIITERFHFYKRDQSAGESITDYDAALRKLATHCAFGTTLDDALRDRFVCGLRHESIQRRLLSEKDLNYTKAMEIARAMEAADANAKSFKDAGPAIRRLAGLPSRDRDARIPCYRCGRTSHAPSDCKFKDATCNHCGKKGHIAPVCRSKAKPLQASSRSTASTGQDRRGRTKQRTTHRVQEVESTTSDREANSGEEYHLFMMTDRSSEPIRVSVIVNGKELEMEVDTGAAVSIISDQTRRSLFPDLQLRKSSLALKTYTDELMEVVGQLNVQVKYGSQEEKLVLVVIGGSGPSLFGRNWLKYIRLECRKIASIRTTRSEAVNTLIKQHQQLFTDKLGTVMPYKAKLQVQPQAAPRFFKPRQVPFAIRDAVGKELDLLEKQGIIEKVSHSDWAAPIVPVPKKDCRF